MNLSLFRNSISSWVALPAERSVLQEFSEPRLVLERLVGFSFNERQIPRVPRGEPVIQHNFHTEGRKVDIPGLNQRVEEGNAVFT